MADAERTETYDYPDLDLAKLHVGSYPNEIYLVADPATKEAWVIDAGYEPERVAAAVRERGLTAKGILITHGHFDHHEHLDDYRRLLGVPAGTVVYPGHGDDTTIGAEAPHLEEWIARGW